MNQKLLQKHLSRIGCSVSVANHGQEAIDIIKRSRWATDDGPPISCVLMDIEVSPWHLSSSACLAYGLTDFGCSAAQMPVLDGMGAIRLLREMERQGKLRGHIPTLAVTANARQEQITAMEKAGFDGTVSTARIVFVPSFQRSGGWTDAALPRSPSHSRYPSSWIAYALCSDRPGSSQYGTSSRVNSPRRRARASVICVGWPV